MSGGDIKRAVLAKLVSQQHNLCALCQHPFHDSDPATIDHKVPIASGGGGSLCNLQAAHWTCNNKRGSIPLAAWHAMQAETGYSYSPEAAAAVVPPEVAKPHTVRQTERMKMEQAVAVMETRIKFLERANTILHCDWQAAISKLREVERIVGHGAKSGGATAHDDVVVTLKAKLKARAANGSGNGN